MEDEFFCPYCNDKYEDALNEYFDHGCGWDSTNIKCDNCNKQFRCERKITIKYETSDLPCEKGTPHQFIYAHNWNNKQVWICEWCEKVEFKEIEQKEDKK